MRRNWNTKKKADINWGDVVRNRRRGKHFDQCYESRTIISKISRDGSGTLERVEPAIFIRGSREKRTHTCYHQPACGRGYDETNYYHIIHRINNWALLGRLPNPLSPLLGNKFKNISGFIENMCTTIKSECGIVNTTFLDMYNVAWTTSICSRIKYYWPLLPRLEYIYDGRWAVASHVWAIREK